MDNIYNDLDDVDNKLIGNHRFLSRSNFIIKNTNIKKRPETALIGGKEDVKRIFIKIKNNKDNKSNDNNYNISLTPNRNLTIKKEKTFFKNELLKNLSSSTKITYQIKDIAKLKKFRLNLKNNKNKLNLLPTDKIRRIFKNNLQSMYEVNLKREKNPKSKIVDRFLFFSFLNTTNKNISNNHLTFYSTGTSPKNNDNKVFIRNLKFGENNTFLKNRNNNVINYNSNFSCKNIKSSKIKLKEVNNFLKSPKLKKTSSNHSKKNVLKPNYSTLALKVNRNNKYIKENVPLGIICSSDYLFT